MSINKRAVLGPPLAEVFLVDINPVAETCELYGTVQVEDEKGILIIYDRGPEKSESIHQNGALSLISPNRTISAHASFKVNFDLKEKNGDVEFLKGSLYWDLWETHELFNKCVSKNVQGKLGSATVYGTVLDSAVQATIHAQLIKVDGGHQRAEVSGSLVARYGDTYYYHCDNHEDLTKNTCIVLFKATEDQPIELSLEEKVDIPLSRSLVAVPTYSSLKFEVKLKCVHSNDHHQELVENYKVEFLANWGGKSEASDIKGKYGIRLSVSWKDNYQDYYGATMED